MFTFLKNKQNTKPKSCTEALSHIDSVLVLNTSSPILVKEFDKRNVDQKFVKRFNRGDSFYPFNQPFASLVVDKHKNSHTLLKSEKSELRPVQIWPSQFGEENYYLRDNTTNKIESVKKLFGSHCKTKIDDHTLEQWILYWGVMDTIEMMGVLFQNVDDRVPTRDRFLTPYRESSWTEDFYSSFSKEEAESQIRMSLANMYRPISAISDIVGEWVDDSPDSLYSAKFHGHQLHVCRHSDIPTIGFYAVKDKHPFLSVLQSQNLI